MAKTLFNILTGKFENAKARVDSLECRIKRVDPGEDIELLQKRLDKARDKYKALENELVKYLSYIPGERTRECMRLTYLEGWSREDLADYYCVDLAVISRELVCGRQIITALVQMNSTKS